jgi:hypothetical protein
MTDHRSTPSVTEAVAQWGLDAVIASAATVSGNTHTDVAC